MIDKTNEEYVDEMELWLRSISIDCEQLEESINTEKKSIELHRESIKNWRKLLSPKKKQLKIAKKDFEKWQKENM